MVVKRSGRKKGSKRDARPLNLRILRLIKSTGSSQASVADAVEVPPSRLSEWIKGKRVPPPEALIRLGAYAAKLGLLEDAELLWSSAGIDRETLALMADSILPRPTTLPFGTIDVPRFRDTIAGRVEAGPVVQLPIEFLPHPENTICLAVDERSSAVVDAPRGLFILDTSVEGQEDLSGLWGRVVILRHPGAGAGAAKWPSGLYAGRLTLHWDSANLREIRIKGTLAMLGRERGYYMLPLGDFVLSGIDATMAGPAEVHELIQQATQRAASEMRLDKGIFILGEVIGRLTGHIKRERSEGAE